MRVQTFRRIQAASSVAVFVALMLLLLLVGYEGWRSFSEKSWQHIVSPAPPGAGQLQKSQSSSAAQSGPLTAEQRLELEQTVESAKSTLLAEVHDNDANERAILDRLITLVGGFSAILALSAWFTLRFAREDALAQISRNEKDLETFQETVEHNLKLFQETAERDLKLFQETAERDLKTFKEDTKSEMEAVTKRIWSELPEMRNFKECLRDLLLDLERTLPAAKEWNSVRSYEALNETQIQKILISESIVNSLQIFISKESNSNRETFANLYRAIARFYAAKFRKEKRVSDAERGDIYLRKSIEIEPSNSSGYAQRGALYLVRHQLLEKDAQNESMKAERLATLLNEAEMFLQEALSRNEGEIGAAYNLAMISARRGAYDKAIEMLSQWALKRSTLNYEQTKKYLPSIYINIACYFAKKADASTDAKDQDEWRNKGVSALEDVYKYFVSQQNDIALNNLREGIHREQESEGDFKNFGEELRSRLSLLLSNRGESQT